MVHACSFVARAQKDYYAMRLQKFFSIPRERSVALVQRWLVAALIDARLCERFKVFSENMEDPELSKFHKHLMISEANHYTTFLTLARSYQDRAIVDEKWKALLAFEATLMKARGNVAKIHG